MDVDQEPLSRFIYVTDGLPLEGEASWGANKGQRLVLSFSEAMPALVEMWRSGPLSEPTSPTVDYRFSSGSATPKGNGWILEENESRFLILSKTIPKTVYSYPRAEAKSPAQRAGLSSFIAVKHKITKGRISCMNDLIWHMKGRDEGIKRAICNVALNENRFV